MAINRTELVKTYRQKVIAANKELTKKEIFKDLLHRLYAGEKEIEKIIDAISAGSERSIINIPRKDKLHRGSADTLYNKIIIEFEKDLKVTLKHAKEQLAGYLLGEFNSGEGYNYTLIASDFITWKVYAPDVLQLDKLEILKEDELILNEVASASFVLTDDNADEFYFWLDRFLFKEQKQKATLERIEEAFGYNSPTFIECYREISKEFQSAKKFGEVQVSHEQWLKFLRIAYGSFEDKGTDFVVHTYLSVFSKMLAYAVVSNDDYIDDDELKGILEGTIFDKYNISNFVDNDFFHWVKSKRNFKNLKKAFRLIAQEISTFDFTDVDEDILKGVYQELIDLDTRHSLGEYYTPDWLCERVVQEYDFKITDKILDPACGSGSFLRAAIHRLKKLNPSITVNEINNVIYGIDIHPLSVQIAKTTVLLSLGKDIANAKQPIHINIILANTLLAPKGVKNLFGDEFSMQIDKEEFLLNTQIFEDVTVFDDALEVCEELAEQTQNKKKEKEEVIAITLQKRYKHGGLSPQVLESFYKIYEGLKQVKERGRDSIWKFIVQNLYKPYFLSDKFDYIIGNPPWFTYSSIKNEGYQNILNAIAEAYDVKPTRVANYPHLEIAAIFLAYCTNYFLKQEGKLAFVLPRSFFSADHHDNTRTAKAKGIKLTSIWDLNDVAPLFRVPSGVLFAEKAPYGLPKSIPAGGLAGKIFSGKIPAHNCNYKTAAKKLTEQNVKWFLVKQGKSSALSTKKTKAQTQINPYKKEFKQGATIVPRTFYFTELTQEIPADFDDRIIHIKTADAIQLDAKAPWKGLKFKGKIESQFIFRTALSKSILPFALYKPDLIVLPIIISKNEKGEKTIKLYTGEELRAQGALDAAKWFIDSENVWDIHRTDKNKVINSVDYLNWQNKLTEQNLNLPYLVLYNASAKDANATVLKRKDLDLEFLVESKAYVYYTKNLKEAYYLAAILNSKTPNQMMKAFQSTGLFGPRDIHKKILDIYYPKFNDKDAVHLKLAELSEQAHTKTATYIKDNPPVELTSMHLGRLRTNIKKHLAKEMQEMDKLVKKVIG
jgi:hypothetical protein